MNFLLGVLTLLFVTGVGLAQRIDRSKPIAPNISPDPMPDSMFVSNCRPQLRLDQEAMGVKWMRGDTLETDDFARQHGYDQLYIICFLDKNRSVNGQIMGAPKAEYLNDDIQAKIDILKQHPDVKYVEFYNEQWWMFTGAPMTEFREDLRKTYQAIKAYNPNIQVLASNTPSSTIDDIAVDGYEKYCDGFAPHNYCGCSDANLYEAPGWRYTDWDRLLMHHFNKSFHWITEGGDQNLPGVGGPDGLYTAYKMVQRLAMYSAEEYSKVTTHMPNDSFSSPALRSAYTIMATLLEDKKPVADLWPASMLTWGEVYEGNHSSVAILFSWAGKNVQTGTVGSVIIESADDIASYDIFGKPVGKFDSDSHRLTFDIGNPPVYLVSTRLGSGLAKAIQSARFNMSQPVKAMIEPISGPVGAGTPLVVRLYNGGVTTHSGTVTASIKDWTMQTLVPFTIKPGKFAAISISVLSAKRNDTNIYAANATVNIDGVSDPVVIEEPVQAAYMVGLTPKMNGMASGWQGSQPVTMATYPQGIDYTRLAYNPTLKNDDTGTQNNVLKVYSAYDKDNLYFAYSIAGQVGGGEWLQVALGLTDWSNHNMRSVDDPWAYKGYFVDSDYIIAINNPTGQLWKLASPNAAFRSPYNWMIACKGGRPEKNLRFVSNLEYENTHFFDMVKELGAKLKRSNQDGFPFVECSIPRSAIPEFHPESGKPIRLSFMLRQTASPDGGVAYEWSRVAGEFSFLRGCGSFVPSWQTYYDNQLPWGVK